MILDRLRLKNVGLYKGEVEIEFASGARRITLIGGKNGAGKTTLLSAIPLALYGGRARSLLGVSSYGEYLNRLVHNGETRSAINLQFHQHEAGKLMRYEVERSWTKGRNGKTADHLEVTVNRMPRPDLENSWPEYVEGLVPLSVSGLVFFDGEKIESLADVSSSSDVLRTSLYGLLGLELVERLRKDLSDYKRRVAHDTPGAASDLTARLLQAEQSLEVLKGEAEAARSSLDGVRQDADAARSQLLSTQEAFAAKGGDIYMKREQLAQDLEASMSTIATERKRLEASVAGDLPLLLVRPLLRRVAEVGEQVQSAEEARLLLHKLKDRDERLLERVESEGDSFTTTQLALLAGLLDEDRERYGAAEVPAFHVPEAAASAASDLVGDDGERLAVETRLLTEMIENEEIRSAGLTSALGSMPDEALIASLQRDLQLAEQEVMAAELRIRVTSEHVAEIERRVVAVQREVDRLATEVIETGATQNDVVRITREIAKADATLARFSSRIVENNASRISRNISDSLAKLLRKDSLISRVGIDPASLELCLFGRNKEELDPATLSAGERQMLATALLWGLARSTRFNLPTVIDTPVGRLDRSHRINLVERYFPEASKQVVLLSTDEEIVGDYHTRLAPHIGASYLLDYDEVSDRTRVTEGYFS